MSQGKFSNPRPHREEEREIEKAYRDLTRKNDRKRRREHQTVAMDPEALKDIKLTDVPENTDFPDISNIPEITEIPDAPTGAGFANVPTRAAREQAPSPAAEDRQIEDAFRQVTGQPVPHRHVLEPERDSVIPEDEEEPSSRPQWLHDVQEFYQGNKKLVLAALCALAVLLITSVILLFVRSAGDPYGEKILNNVYIGDVNVGGMTQKDAIAALNEAYGDVYATEDMVIDLSGTELRITPKESGASFDAAAAVEEAYAYGRTGTQEERDDAYKASKKEPYNIAVLSYLNLKTDNIQKFLTEKSENTNNTLVQATYGLEGEEPELAADKFDKSAPCQTLVITLGMPGVGFDPEVVYNQVLDAYSARTFLVTVEDVEILKEPDPVDLEKLYKEFYIEPVNATYDSQSGKTNSGSYGYGFDVEEGQKLLDAAEFGEEVRIPMEYIEPDILSADGFFRDTLGEYQTRGTSNDSRNNNLRLACQAIDGKVLNPGESFSFQNTVGSLTSARGYKNAPEDSGMDDTMGGGVTQVASTLYCAALLSDVTVTSRQSLAQMPSYIGSGLEAGTGLKLQNNLKYPVCINASYSGGYVRISFSGTEERDYYRMLGSEVTNTYKADTEYVTFTWDNSEGYENGDVLQEGRDGYQVKSYTVRYARSNDAKISSDYVATSEYGSVNHIVARVDVQETEAEETTQETEETEETTESTEQTDSGFVSIGGDEDLGLVG